MTAVGDKPTGGSEAARLLRARLVAVPVEARAEIVRAFELSRGNAVQAARLLGIGHRTMLRIMHDEAGIAEAIEAIRRKHERKPA